MSRPEDIPQDVWEAAMRVAVEMEIHAAVGSRTDAKAACIAVAMVEVAARAILAAKAEEREACAVEVIHFDQEARFADLMSHGIYPAQVDIQKAIAADIRKRGEA